MAWCRIDDIPLSKPILTRFNDAYMQHLGELNSWIRLYNPSIELSSDVYRDFPWHILHYSNTSLNVNEIFLKTKCGTCKFPVMSYTWPVLLSFIHDFTHHVYCVISPPSWDIADVNMYMYVFNKWRWSRTAGTICHSLCPRDEVYRRAVPATPSDATTFAIGEHRQGPLLLRTSVGWKRTLSGAARDQNVSLNPRNFNWRNFLLCTLLMIWYKFCKFDFRNEYK